MTDNEIIKALECCIISSQGQRPCVDCHYSIKSTVDNSCCEVLMKDALDLINRQKAEIENLNDILYDADGVNLVNYWYQQCEIAENGCRNFEEENENLKAEIKRLRTALDDAWEAKSELETKISELQYDLCLLKQERSVVEAEANKEFAEYMKKYLSNHNAVSASFVSGLIDEYVKQKTIE